MTQWGNKHLFIWLEEEVSPLCQQYDGLILPIIAKLIYKAHMHRIHLSAI